MEENAKQLDELIDPTTEPIVSLGTEEDLPDYSEKIL